MSIRLNRRQFGVTALAASTPVFGQTFPSKPISIVVGYPAGGGVDVVMRTLAPTLSARVGQPVVIDNRPGASGILAAGYVAGAQADGHTLFGTDGGALALNGAMFSKLPYDPVKAFAPVSLVIRAPILIAAHPRFPANDLRGLIELAKRERADLSYASAGLGTYHHLAMELLKRRAGFTCVPVQYRGAAPAVQDVIAGQVPIIPIDSIVGLPQLRAGKLKVLAALAPTRLTQLPDVPTARELGLNDVEVFPWVGIVAPAAIPEPRLKRLSAEVRESIAAADVSKKFIDLGMEPYGTSPEEFAAFVQREIGRWHPLIKQLNIKLD